jgi:hypothetical protein
MNETIRDGYRCTAKVLRELAIKSRFVANHDAMICVAIAMEQEADIYFKEELKDGMVSTS